MPGRAGGGGYMGSAIPAFLEGRGEPSVSAEEGGILYRRGSPLDGRRKGVEGKPEGSTLTSWGEKL